MEIGTCRNCEHREKGLREHPCYTCTEIQITTRTNFKAKPKENSSKTCHDCGVEPVKMPILIQWIDNIEMDKEEEEDGN